MNENFKKAKDELQKLYQDYLQKNNNFQGLLETSENELDSLISKNLNSIKDFNGNFLKSHKNEFLNILTNHGITSDKFQDFLGAFPELTDIKNKYKL